MKQFTLFILLLLAFAGCSTIPVYDVEPLEENVDYYQGRAITFKETDFFSSWTVFEKSDYKEIAFYITVKNNSDEKVLLSPEMFYLSFDKIDNKVFPSLDPENEINDLKKAQMSADQSHSLNTGLNFLLTTVSVAADVADPDLDNVQETLANASSIQQNENSHYSETTYNLDNQLNYWQNEALRKTTLYPDEEISGFVYFVYKRKEDKFTLNIPLKNEMHSHRFELKKLN